MEVVVVRADSRTPPRKTSKRDETQRRSLGLPIVTLSLSAKVVTRVGIPHAPTIAYLLDHVEVSPLQGLFFFFFFLNFFKKWIYKEGSDFLLSFHTSLNALLCRGNCFSLGK